MTAGLDTGREAEAERWYAQYGRTMLGYQSLETSMVMLVLIDQGDSPDFSTFEEAWENVDKLYDLTFGRLQGMVGTNLSEELVEDLERARKDRNYLAHQYLVTRVEELNWGSDHRREMIRVLEGTQVQLGEVIRTITELAREHARTLGFDPTAAPTTAER